VKEADSMEDQKVRALIGRLLGEAREGLLKTQLVKFLYLIDLEWVKATGAPLTGLSWRFHHHGPWDDAIEAVLLDMKRAGALAARKGIRPDGAVYEIYTANAITSDESLTAAEKLVVDHVCDTYRRLSVRRLLDDVVYETPPMLRANKGERLDLTLAGRYDEDLSFLVGGWPWGPGH
jgi:hypothetical protein